jgi:hypothetical protein
MPFIRLVLDSSYVRKTDNTFGQLLDGTNYKWNDLTYELDTFLPPQKITELLESDSYRIYLESLVWNGRTLLDNDPFKVLLPGIQNDVNFGNRKSNNDGLLQIVYETYSPNVNFETRSDKGILTMDKQWLTSKKLRVAFAKVNMATDAFANADFGNEVKYTMTLLIEY